MLAWKRDILVIVTDFLLYFYCNVNFLVIYICGRTDVEVKLYFNA